jgi:hypothetical protein
MHQLCRLDLSRGKELYRELDVELRALAQQLRTRYRASKILAFGSYARQDLNEGSDIDLLIVGEFTERFQNESQPSSGQPSCPSSHSAIPRRSSSSWCVLTTPSSLRCSKKRSSSKRGKKRLLPAEDTSTHSINEPTVGWRRLWFGISRRKNVKPTVLHASILSHPGRSACNGIGKSRSTVSITVKKRR